MINLLNIFLFILHMLTYITLFAASVFGFKNHGILGIIPVLVTFCVFELIMKADYKYLIVNLIIFFSTMFFYYSSNNIEDVYAKLAVLMVILILINWWKIGNKDGFRIIYGKYRGNKTFYECQQICKSDKTCKYSQTPNGTSKTGDSGPCYTGDRITGGVNQNDPDVWTYSLYNPPTTVSGSQSGYKNICRGSNYLIPDNRKTDKGKNLNMIVTGGKLTANKRDQGWGNSTWGIYLDGFDKNGQRVLRMQIPSTHKPGRNRFKTKSTTKIKWYKPQDTPVTKVRCFIYARGWGHCTKTKSVSYQLTGYNS